MSQKGGESSGMPEKPAENVIMQENEQINLKPLVDRNLVNGYYDGTAHLNYSPDELVKMMIDLNFQNGYMKPQYEGLKNHILDTDRPDQPKVLNHDDLECGYVKWMRGLIECLKRDLAEERQIRDRAEEALKHLRAAHSEADMKDKSFLWNLLKLNIRRIKR